jgi:dolichyl-phosphate beta-glucosyltransferase
LIPAYNEEFRIQATLEDIDAYFADTDTWNGTARILVVDDGSTDQTVQVVQTVATAALTTKHIDCLRMDQNQGKGAAVSFGVQHIYRTLPESLILITDADGSADMECFESMYTAYLDLAEKSSPNDNGCSDTLRPLVVVGYRSDDDASRSRVFFRWAFRTLIRHVIGDLGVRDTQCGFKLLTATAAHALYKDLHLMGWTHDVEVLYKCRALSIPIAESPVSWQDKEGSKLVASPGGIVAVSFGMLFEVLVMRLSYMTGRWNIPRS